MLEEYQSLPGEGGPGSRARLEGWGGKDRGHSGVSTLLSSAGGPSAWDPRPGTLSHIGEPAATGRAGFPGHWKQDSGSVRLGWKQMTKGRALVAEPGGWPLGRVTFGDLQEMRES